MKQVIAVFSIFFWKKRSERFVCRVLLPEECLIRILEIQNNCIYDAETLYSFLETYSHFISEYKN